MLHARLAAAFEALDAAGVRWCLLRVPSNPAAPSGDVDLLIETSDAEVLGEVLRTCGFVAVPGWQRLPGMLWIAFDEDSGCFLVLDITDEVSFGPEGLFRTNTHTGCLARRRQDGPLSLLDDDDAFWALLLHCLLDKSTIPEHYHQRLVAMGRTASVEGPLAHVIASVAGPDAAPVALRAAAQSADWPALQAMAAPLTRSWRAALTPFERARPATTQARRWARAPLLLRRRRGVSVALLGLNGAGKSTLTAGIAEAFPFPVSEVYMGLWKSGDLPGGEIPLVAPLLRPVLAWRRYLSGLRSQLLGRLVIFDRYVHDARLPPAPPYLRAKQVYMWLLARSVPPPDVVLLLDLPAEAATGRKDERTREQNEVERAAYLAMAANLGSIEVLDASRGRDAVRTEALTTIWQHYRRRWGAGGAPTGTGPRDQATHR